MKRLRIIYQIFEPPFKAVAADFPPTVFSVCCYLYLIQLEKCTMVSVLGLNNYYLTPSLLIYKYTRSNLRVSVKEQDE